MVRQKVCFFKVFQSQYSFWIFDKNRNIHQQSLNFFFSTENQKTLMSCDWYGCIDPHKAPWILPHRRSIFFQYNDIKIWKIPNRLDSKMNSFPFYSSFYPKKKSCLKSKIIFKFHLANLLCIRIYIDWQRTSSHTFQFGERS